MKRFVTAAWNNIGFVCVALVLVYCVVHAFDPPRLNWGDSMSDYNVMNSGRNFATYGFLHLRLTPFLIDPQYLTNEDRMLLYTHYPQLPDLMNGMLRVVFHLSDIVQFRFVALGFSFSALFFVYQVICRYWQRATGQMALALWVINPLWLQHADYLHEEPYGAFFGFGCLYFLTRYLDDTQRRRWLVVSGIFMTFTFFASYNYWFFTPLLVAIILVGHYKAVFDKRVLAPLATLAAFAVAAVLLKFSTNAWALGGISGGIQDLRFQFTERATDAVTRTHYQNGIIPVAYGRIERFFSLLFFPIAVFWAVFPLLRARWAARSEAFTFEGPNPWILFLAALPFLCLFVELWVGQYYPTLLVLPFYAVASGALIALLARDRNRLVAAMGLTLAVALIVNSVAETASFKKAFFQRSTIASLAARLDSVSARGQHILVNHTFDAPYRYYFHRNTNTMILIPPGVADIALESMANPRTHPLSGTPTGAIFVEHKHLTDEMYDKSYYYILGRYGFWRFWGNPEQYRAPIDTLIAERDSVLMSKVAAVGQKLYDTDDYSIWRIRPPVDSTVPK
ncbi:MAG TPA: glycosyltransferase family 39 protein [Gemmatimonadaceae bacterium]|jgi:hypothetical protein